MKRRSILLTGSVAALAWATGAVAQTPAASSGVAGQRQTTASQPVGLQEVIVTAQRRTENLQKAPIAVTAIQGDTVREASITSPQELNKLVPALQIGQGIGPHSNFYVRGVGGLTSNAGFEGGIAFNYDGVAVVRPGSTNSFFYDVERIEVLKGPQGTLYGRNASGGAINILPATPKFDPAGSISFEAGNYGSARIDTMVNAPVSDTVAVRIAAIYSEHDAYMKDGTDDQDEKGARLQVLYKPTSDLDIRIAADYFKMGGHGAGGTPVAAGLLDSRAGLLSPQGGAWINSLFNVFCLCSYPNLAGFHPFLNAEFWGVNATINYHTDLGTFTIVPAYRHSHQRTASDVFTSVLLQDEPDRQRSIEVRYASPEDKPLKAILGGYYLKETVDELNIVANFLASWAVATSHYGTESYAGFANATYEVSPQVRLTAGVRYTDETKTLKDSDSTTIDRFCILSTGCPTFVPFPIDLATLPTGFLGTNGAVGPDGAIASVARTVTVSNSLSIKKWTYKVGADWDITPQNMVYVSYATGFKSGGFYIVRPGPTATGVYRPETITAWTIGSKNRFFDNRLQINAEGFYWNYQNQQLTSIFINDFGNSVFGTRNVGRSVVKGFELDGQLLPAENTLLSADIQYLSAEATDFAFKVPNLGAPPQYGCPTALDPSGATFTVNCADKTLPEAPKWTVNLGAAQTFPLGGGGKIVLQGRAHYQSRTLTELEFTAPEYQAAYWLVDASLTFFSRDDHFSVGAFVNNIGDETVRSTTYQTSFTSSPNNAVGILQPPRTYGVRVGYKY